jgi:uncharacterized protein with FMN-binding domain
MRRALPAIVVTATGLTWLLRAQGVIDTGTLSPAATATDTTDRAATGDGAVPGQSITTQYGPVQVAAVVRAGRLADVQELQAPDDNPNSKRINGMAIPVLRQEAIAAQSAKIDAVAGATFTSEAYRKSLQSAIDAAAAQPGAPATTGAPTTAPPTTTAQVTTTIKTATTPPAPTSTTTVGDGPTTAPPTTTTITADGKPVPIATGPVQVQVTVAGGRIAEVHVLQVPTGNPTSAAINARAVPKLRDETLTAQSAKTIAAVTGATLTSEAFRTSLQDALDQARFTG